MNNIILYQTNEHIFLNFYTFAGFRDIFYDKNIARYDWNTIAHDHLKCKKCGKIIDIKMHTKELQKEVWNQYKFKSDNIEITITGICNNH